VLVNGDGQVKSRSDQLFLGTEFRSLNNVFYISHVACRTAENFLEQSFGLNGVLAQLNLRLGGCRTRPNTSGPAVFLTADIIRYMYGSRGH